MNRESRKTLATNARNRITFQGPLCLPDGEGGFNNIWIDVATVWAEINAIKAMQNFKYQSINVNATHRIIIRGRFVANGTCKLVGDIWALTWNGIPGETVTIEYQINGGAWTTISAVVINTGKYNWTIPAVAIGQNVICKISEN